MDAKPRQLHISEDGSSFYTFKTRNQNISFDTIPCIIWDAQLSQFTCRSSLFPLDWNPQRLILHPIYPIHLQLILCSCLTKKHFDIFARMVIITRFEGCGLFERNERYRHIAIWQFSGQDLFEV